MKRLFIMCILSLFTFGLQAQTKRIAVAPFTSGAGLNENDVKGISNIFVTYFKPEGYELIDRTKLEDILKEQNLQKSDITEEAALDVFNHILNLTEMVNGSISIAMGEYNVEVWVVDVKTSAIKASCGASFNSSSYRKNMQALAEELASQIAIKTTVEHIISSKELIEQFSNGATAYRNGLFSEAIMFLDRFLDNAKDSRDQDISDCISFAKRYITDSYSQLGITAIQQKNYKTAIDYLGNASERAYEYDDMGSKHKADALLAKACAIYGGEAFNRSDYTTAALIFQKGHNANPRDMDMALNLAMSYCESGDYEKGLNLYRKIAAMSTERYADAVAKANQMIQRYSQYK